MNQKTENSTLFPTHDVDDGDMESLSWKTFNNTLVDEWRKFYINRVPAVCKVRRRRKRHGWQRRKRSELKSWMEEMHGRIRLLILERRNCKTNHNHLARSMLAEEHWWEPHTDLVSYTSVKLKHDKHAKKTYLTWWYAACSRGSPRNWDWKLSLNWRYELNDRRDITMSQFDVRFGLGKKDVRLILITESHQHSSKRERRLPRR
jgi:hypothetical protein